MAYTNGNSVLVANPTSSDVTVGGTTVKAGQCAEVTPGDAVAITLSAGLTKGTPVTSLAVTALGQAIQAGTVVDIQETISGVVQKQQAFVTATAAAAATSLTISSLTPVASFTTGATLLSSSQGDVAGFVEAGCTVSTVGTQLNDVLDVPVQLAEKGAHLLEAMARPVLSAGSDTFGKAGL